MSTTTVRVTEETRKILRELALEAGEPIQEVLAKAVETYRREQILKQANAAYAALRADPQAWQEEIEERAAWEATLADDLENT